MRAGLALSGALVVVALELALRLVAPPRLAANWLYDPVLGHRGPKNEVVRLISLPEGTRYNRYGFRGDDPSPDRFSIFLLGDSITEAVQVPWESSFAKLLEVRLPSVAGRKPQVISWASSDYGTADELLAYASEAKALPHDVVALEFLGLNDFVNNNLAFAERNRALSDFSRPYLVPESRRGSVTEFDLLGDGTPFTYLAPRWKWLRENVRIFAYADFLWRGYEWRNRLATTHGARPGLCPLESQVFLDDGGPEWREAYEVTLRLAKELKRQVESRRPAPRLVAFYVPSLFELSDPEWNDGLVLDLTRCNMGGYHRENPERRFLQLFGEAGIETFSLRKALARSGLPPRQLYLPDGHFTLAGHQVISWALQQWLTEPSSRASPRQR